MPLPSMSGNKAAVLAVPMGEMRAKTDWASTNSVTFFRVRAGT